MKRPPAFQFYVDNFIEGTCDMTDAEVGFYMRLLCAQWSRGGLPNDDGELMRFSHGCTTLELQRIKRKFVKSDDGLLRNRRLELEREKQQLWREKSVIGGKISADKRKATKSGATTAPTTAPTKRQRKREPKGNTPVSDLRIPSPDPIPVPVPSSISTPPEVAPCGAHEEPVAEVAPPKTDHELFIDAWVTNFQPVLGFQYTFDGAKDGRAVRELLRSKIPYLELIEIAKAAWAKHIQKPLEFAFKQSVTIHGFQSHFVVIRTALSHETNRRNRPGGHRAITGAEQRQLGIPEQPHINLSDLLDNQRPPDGVATPPPADAGDQPGSALHG